jgi:hypothetical protein
MANVNGKDHFGPMFVVLERELFAKGYSNVIDCVEVLSLFYQPWVFLCTGVLTSQAGSSIVAATPSGMVSVPINMAQNMAQWLKTTSQGIRTGATPLSLLQVMTDALERFYWPWKIAYFRPFSNVISIQTFRVARKKYLQHGGDHRWRHGWHHVQVLYMCVCGGREGQVYPGSTLREATMEMPSLPSNILPSCTEISDQAKVTFLPYSIAGVYKLQFCCFFSTATWPATDPASECS